MPSLALQKQTSIDSSNGGRLVTTDGRELPLRDAALQAKARGGLARVVLEQRFSNPFAEPLQVTYQMPLPADGAVSGYAFRIGDRRIVGEVDTRAQARERFEEAVLQGHTAALLEQERSSLFTQELGNVPPHAEIVAELTVDQKLSWLPDGQWEWRFPTVVAPRYLGAEGRVPDQGAVTVEVADRPLPVRLSLALSVGDPLAEGLRPESPSHPLRTSPIQGRFEVALADERGAALDRDLVVRWKVARLEVGTTLDLVRPSSGVLGESAFGLLTLVPPLPEACQTSIPRDLILLLDTSGSMSGEPLNQARRIASAMVDSLGDRDRLEMIEFSDAPHRWKRRSVEANASNRKDALRWLAKLQASGGTEMVAGILEALAALRDDAQRQVVLVTDGLIGFESEVLCSIRRRLPPATRLHVVGVGSAVNRSLTGPAARAGRGVELVVGLREDPEVAAQRLLARTVAPLVTGLSISGEAVVEAAPVRAPDLFAGAPALLALQLRPQGGEVRISGTAAEGPFEQRLTVRPVDPGQGSEAIAKLFAREKVEDLELDRAAGGDGIDVLIERMGLEYQISTRLTSWVAVCSESTVDPRDPKRRIKMPEQLPHGMSAEGLGLRHALAAAPTGAIGGAPALLRSMAMAPRAEKARLWRPATSAPERKKEFQTHPPTFAEEESQVGFDQDDGQAASRTIQVRMRIQEDGQVVVQFEVEGAPLDWKPENVHLILADGRIESVEVINTATTHEGTLAIGLTVTLVLQFPAGADLSSLSLLRAVGLDSAGEPLLLVL